MSDIVQELKLDELPPDPTFEAVVKALDYVTGRLIRDGAISDHDYDAYRRIIETFKADGHFRNLATPDWEQFKEMIGWD